MPEAGAVSPAMEKGHQVRARRYVTVFCKRRLTTAFKAGREPLRERVTLCHYVILNAGWLLY